MSTPPDARAALERLLGAGAVASGRARADLAELPLALPADEEQLAEVLRLAGREGLAVVPLGLGSKLGWCAPPARADLLVSTRRIAGVVSHEPADGTLAARAGTPMSALRAAARTGGHWVTPDLPRPERATLGGALAAGESGADRQRFGPTRNHVLGARVVLADGTRARSGGQLVKNVTGYDLHRLYTGSHGTLCVLIEAALRLFPEPEREVLAELQVDSAAAMSAESSRLRALPARVVSLVAARAERGAPWLLRARLGGKGAAVEAERAQLLAAWPAARVLDDAEARERAEAARDGAIAAGGGPWLRLACRPSQLPTALDALERALAPFGSPRLEAQPGIALLDARLPGMASDRWPALATAVRDLRRDLPAATVAARDLPSAALADLDPFGEPGPALPLMRRLQAALDPTAVLARGRFHAAL